MKKRANEALSATSTVEEFVNQISKDIADFITVNRPAFSSDNEEAFNEYLGAIAVDDVKTRILELLENPSDIAESDEVVEDTDTEEKPVERTEVNDDLVDPEILSMLDED